MHVCTELCARFRLGSSDEAFKKIAKSYFVHYTAMEHLLTGIKTNSFIFAHDMDGANLDDIMILAAVINFRNREEFNAALTSVLMDDYGVGQIKTNPGMRYVYVGKRNPPQNG